eukprot:m.201667 g.201667  ORF g.201667 m.201667 type:complete len:62 (-) comp32804_c3_seq4:1779-1964(-)
MRVCEENAWDSLRCMLAKQWQAKRVDTVSANTTTAVLTKLRHSLRISHALAVQNFMSVCGV